MTLQILWKCHEKTDITESDYHWKDTKEKKKIKRWKGRQMCLKMLTNVIQDMKGKGSDKKYRRPPQNRES